MLLILSIKVSTRLVSFRDNARVNMVYCNADRNVDLGKLLLLGWSWPAALIWRLGFSSLWLIPGHRLGLHITICCSKWSSK